MRRFILLIIFLSAFGICYASDAPEDIRLGRFEIINSYKSIDKYISENSLQDNSYIRNNSNGAVTETGHIKQKDWPGIKRDISYFMGYQFLAVGVLYISPQSISEWSQEQKDNASLKKYTHHINKIVWDNDAYWINYIVHPYWGGAYYVRARERGYNNVESFWFSVLFSTLFEFGVEAIFEYPSFQDLIVTPVVGTYLGQGFMGIRADIYRRNKTGHFDPLLLVLTDPLGSINEIVDRIFGRKVRTELNLAIISPSSAGYLYQSENESKNSVSDRGVLGVRVKIRW